jgi:LCP family protein required for cell wall assembly
MSPVRGYGALERVFADEEPEDVLGRNGLFLERAIPLPRSVPKDAWELALVERLGPGEVAPLERSPARGCERKARPARSRGRRSSCSAPTRAPATGVRARHDHPRRGPARHRPGSAFGVPRNLAQVPLGRKRTPSREPLNALYGASGGGAQGASALKQAVSNLLGIRVDYYALVNLLGFEDLVDALGGVEIEVKGAAARRGDPGLRGASRSRPSMSSRGSTYRFYGRDALAYVRSRKDSSDYTRMARPALLPERAGRPTRPGACAAELRLAGEDDRDERAARISR